MRPNRSILNVCCRCGSTFVSHNKDARPNRPRRFCSRTCVGAQYKRRPEEALRLALSKLDRSSPNGCWVWTAGKKNRHGYGGIWNGTKWVYAHRFFYEALVGPIPDGEDVLHHCDNPPCCFADPDPLISHLFTGTPKHNSIDREAKGRGLKGRTVKPEHRKQGSKHGQAKLTEGIVAIIRERYAAGGISQQALAHQFGVSPSTIGDVVHGKLWKHVP